MLAYRFGFYGSGNGDGEVDARQRLRSHAAGDRRADHADILHGTISAIELPLNFLLTCLLSRSIP